MHAFDRQLGLRCFAVAVVLTLLAAGLIVATDEVGSTLGLRAARLAAIVPGLTVVAQRVTLSQSRERGETRALEALGASPWRVARGAAVAGWVVGALAFGAIASPIADVRSLFPSIAAPAAWTTRDAELYDPASGASVAADGSIVLESGVGPTAMRAAPGRVAALGCIAPLAIVGPAWGVTRLGLGARLLGAGVTLAFAITLLHAVAAGRVGPAWLVLAALPLLGQALFGNLRRSVE